MPDSPQLGRFCCPTCEPDADPLAQILIIDYCEFHKPSLAGADDVKAGTPAVIIGNSDTDGTTQREMARLLR